MHLTSFRLSSAPSSFPNACDGWCQCEDHICLRTEPYCNDVCSIFGECLFEVFGETDIDVSISAYNNTIQILILSELNIDVYHVKLSFSGLSTDVRSD